jgi:beta-xylosidase
MNFGTLRSSLFAIYVCVCAVVPCEFAFAQWQPDNGDGTYENPVLFADYSDPDVIRAGNDFILVSSSFSHFPGLPILRSQDLVNWNIIGHATMSYPDSAFVLPQHGMAIWAPSIRYHAGEYRIYFGDPDRGLFMTHAKDPAGPWEPLLLIRAAKGWIDPCPFWDDDGNAYLVHAWANSRAGIKSILTINTMNADGTEILDDGITVFDGHQTQPTIEGPKLYKRNGYYYIFAPAGGVKRGWQTVLRSRIILGPYEERIALEQGSTTINGPHQGAWVTTASGEDWFLHFQDRRAYGRVVHLEPMRWENDWPVIGIDTDGNGIGEPVTLHRKPATNGVSSTAIPQTFDEFDSASLGLQWQWEANPQLNWYSLTEQKGWLRLYAQRVAGSSLWSAPALLLQKFLAPDFAVTVKLDCSSLKNEDRAGLTIFGLNYATVSVRKKGNSLSVLYGECISADKGNEERITAIDSVAGALAYLRVTVNEVEDQKAMCTFSYSADGYTFSRSGSTFTAREGIWVGAKVGVFCQSDSTSVTSGYVDCDWFRVE